jgi:tetratricopeptide (TPR) repeat protein
MAARARLELARILLSLGRTGEAADEAAAGCQTTAALGARDRSTARWRRLLTSCLTTRSRVALASGERAQALSLAQQALAAARSEHTGDAVTDRYIVAAACRLLGDVRQRSNDSKGAASAWSDGLAQLPPNATERPWEMSEHAELLRRLGKAEAARPLTQRLSAIGYRSVM